MVSSDNDSDKMLIDGSSNEDIDFNYSLSSIKNNALTIDLLNSGLDSIIMNDGSNSSEYECRSKIIKFDNL